MYSVLLSVWFQYLQRNQHRCRCPTVQVIVQTGREFPSWLYRLNSVVCAWPCSSHWPWMTACAWLHCSLRTWYLASFHCWDTVNCQQQPDKAHHELPVGRLPEKQTWICLTLSQSLTFDKVGEGHIPAPSACFSPYRPLTNLHTLLLPSSEPSGCSMKISSVKRPYRNAVVTSNCATCSFSFAAMLISDLIVSKRATGQNVSLKSLPASCEKPRTTSLALYRWALPSTPSLTLNSHLQLIALRSADSSISSYVLFFIWASISSFMAFFHFSASADDLASV